MRPEGHLDPGAAAKLFTVAAAGDSCGPPPRRWI